MQAIILAAGSGSRLGAFAEGLPKCLLPVGGRPLIEHQLDALSRGGVDRVLAVTGYAADRVRDRLDGRVDLAHNDRYACTNSLYSLWLARDWVEGPVAILNSDVLFGPEIVDRVADGPDRLAFDSTSGGEEEHMKVRVRDGVVADIAKTIPSALSDGENLGMIHLGADSVRRVLDRADRLVRSGIDRVFWAEALRPLVREGEVALRAVDMSDLPWIEIDYPDDLLAARREVWPAIRDGRCVAPRRRALARSA